MSNALIFYPGILHPVVSPIADGINPLSDVVVSGWNIHTRISATRSSNWKIVAYGINKQLNAQFNARTRLHKIGNIVSYGITHPIVWPISDRTFIPALAYDIDKRISTYHSFKWKIIYRESASKKIRFDCLVTIYSNKTTSFNTKLAVHKPGLSNTGWLNQILEPVVHPISKSSSQTQPYFQFNSAKRIKSSKTIRFASTIKRSASKAFTFRDLAQEVVVQRSVLWETKKAVISSKAASWKSVQRFYRRRSISWSLRSSLVKQKAYQWRTTNHVTGTKSAQWALDKRLIKQKEIRYNVNVKVPVWTSTRFRTLQHIVMRKWQLVPNYGGSLETGIVHPISYRNPQAIPMPDYGLNKPVVYPISVSQYPGYGQVVNPGIQWRTGINPSGRVQCAKQVAYNALYKLPIRQRTQWVIVGRASFHIRSVFNVYNDVSDKLSLSWNIGMWVPSHIRQTSQVRTDFAY